MNKRLVWVHVYGGVVGFDPDEIEKFNQEYRRLEKYGIDYWGFFNEYFAEELGGHYAVSARR